jgi:hypothetical protein
MRSCNQKQKGDADVRKETRDPYDRGNSPKMAA